MRHNSLRIADRAVHTQSRERTARQRRRTVAASASSRSLNLDMGRHLTSPLPRVPVRRHCTCAYTARGRLDPTITLIAPRAPNTSSSSSARLKLDYEAAFRSI